jgi:rhodanese-related sulfurtransferase
MTTETMNAAEKAKEFFSVKLDFTIGPLELHQQIDRSENITVIDVRAAEDFIKGHLPRAINLPEGNWEKIGRWRKEKTLMVYSYSQTCHLAAQAAKEFASQGHAVREMEGGFETWKKNKLPVEV